MSALQEAERKQLEQREAIVAATNKVEEQVRNGELNKIPSDCAVQTGLLNDLENLIGDISRQGKALEEELSLFVSEPTCIAVVPTVCVCRVRRNVHSGVSSIF